MACSRSARDPRCEASKSLVQSRPQQGYITGFPSAWRGARQGWRHNEQHWWQASSCGESNPSCSAESGTAAAAAACKPCRNSTAGLSSQQPLGHTWVLAAGDVLRNVHHLCAVDVPAVGGGVVGRHFCCGEAALHAAQGQVRHITRCMNGTGARRATCKQRAAQRKISGLPCCGARS